MLTKETGLTGNDPRIFLGLHFLSTHVLPQIGWNTAVSLSSTNLVQIIPYIRGVER